MMHIGPGDVRSPINLPATQGFDIYPQERPHQPHQPHWMPHGVDPHNHMPVRHMAEGPAAAPGSTVPMVDGQGRYEAPTLQQLQIWHHMNSQGAPRSRERSDYRTSEMMLKRARRLRSQRRRRRQRALALIRCQGNLFNFYKLF
jgi:hypothetical protein